MEIKIPINYLNDEFYKTDNPNRKPQRRYAISLPAEDVFQVVHFREPWLKDLFFQQKFTPYKTTVSNYPKILKELTNVERKQDDSAIAQRYGDRLAIARVFYKLREFDEDLYHSAGTFTSNETAFDQQREFIQQAIEVIRNGPISGLSITFSNPNEERYDQLSLLEFIYGKGHTSDQIFRYLADPFWIATPPNIRARFIENTAKATRRQPGSENATVHDYAEALHIFELMEDQHFNADNGSYGASEFNDAREKHTQAVTLLRQTFFYPPEETDKKYDYDNLVQTVSQYLHWGLTERILDIFGLTEPDTFPTSMQLLARQANHAKKFRSVYRQLYEAASAYQASHEYLKLSIEKEPVPRSKKKNPEAKTGSQYYSILPVFHSNDKVRANGQLSTGPNKAFRSLVDVKDQSPGIPEKVFRAIEKFNERGLGRLYKDEINARTALQKPLIFDSIPQLTVGDYQIIIEVIPDVNPSQFFIADIILTKSGKSVLGTTDHF